MDAYTTGGAGLSSAGGDVVADNGATIISSNSQGDDSTMFGSAALREIQAGVANGDPPDFRARPTYDRPADHPDDAAPGILAVHKRAMDRH